MPNSIRSSVQTGQNDAIFTGAIIGGAAVSPVIVFVIVIGVQVAGASVDFHCFAFG